MKRLVPSRGGFTSCVSVRPAHACNGAVHLAAWSRSAARTVPFKELMLASCHSKPGKKPERHPSSTRHSKA